MNLADQVDFAKDDTPKTGEMIIHRYTSIGILKGNGKIEIEAREIANHDRPTRHYIGVKIETLEEYSQKSISLISYESIDELVETLTNLAAVTIPTVKFAFSEIQYSLDGLQVVVFNNSRNNICAMLTIENQSMIFDSNKRLVELKDLILKAKKHLDANSDI